MVSNSAARSASDYISPDVLALLLYMKAPISSRVSRPRAAEHVRLRSRRARSSRARPPTGMAPSDARGEPSSPRARRSRRRRSQMTAGGMMIGVGPRSWSRPDQWRAEPCAETVPRHIAEDLWQLRTPHVRHRVQTTNDVEFRGRNATKYAKASAARAARAGPTRATRTPREHAATIHKTGRARTPTSHSRWAAARRNRRDRGESHRCSGRPPRARASRAAAATLTSQQAEIARGASSKRALLPSAGTARVTATTSRSVSALVALPSARRTNAFSRCPTRHLSHAGM